jgi:CheY-like chemotaxis protein
MGISVAVTPEMVRERYQDSPVWGKKTMAGGFPVGRRINFVRPQAERRSIRLDASVDRSVELLSADLNRVLTGIRIVIVDDDRDMCDALQYLLESYGAEVTVATSAAEALEAGRAPVAMPGESGHDLMRKIAARVGGGAPPAVALSSYAKETERKQAIAAGFRTLLAKPIDPEALVAGLQALPGGRLAKNSGARPSEHASVLSLLWDRTPQRCGRSDCPCPGSSQGKPLI